MSSLTPEKIKLIAQDLRATVNENNVLDSLLELFASQQARVQTLERDVGLLRARMQTREILLPEAQRTYSGRRSIKIDAGLPLQEDQGFYELEYDRLGQPYRWVGPKRSFHFDLHLDRTVPLEFRIRFGKHPIGTGDRLRCFSDNIEIPMVRETSSAFVQFSAVLLPREIIGLTRLIFVAAKSFLPAVAQGAADARRLCVLFYELNVGQSSVEADMKYLAAAKLDPDEPAQPLLAEPEQIVKVIRAQPATPTTSKSVKRKAR